MNQEEKKVLPVPRIQSVKFIERSNGTIKGYAVNTFHGLVKNYNEDRVSIIMNITKPNFKGRWPRCSYFGVFDGHGGNKCSDFLKENMHKYITENSHFPHQPIEALKFGFKKAQQQFLSYAESQNPIERSGSCAIVVLIIDEICYIANVGDSRAILSTNMGKTIYAISKDHKPQSQKQRIYNSGGKIYQSSIKNKAGNIIFGPFRIEPGKLSVSRAFGDIQAKLPKYQGNPKVLIAKPQITYFQINNEEHDFVMICSDGVYDKLANQEVAKCFWDLKDKKLQQKDKYQFIGSVPSKVIERSMEKMSMDNLTSLVIVFEDQGRLMLPPKKTERQTSRRPYSSIGSDLENSLKLGNNLKNRQVIAKEESILNQKYSQNEDPNQYLQQKYKQNRDHKRDNSQHFKKQAKDPIQRIIKRKSTTNIFSNTIDKKIQNIQPVSNSLNSSSSAKLLMAGSKVFQKNKGKQACSDKISINELLHKKKSVDHLKRQKQHVWKQMMTQKASELKQKFIRF